MPIDKVIFDTILSNISFYIPISISLRNLEVNSGYFYKHISPSQKRELDEAKALYRSKKLSNAYAARRKYGLIKQTVCHFDNDPYYQDLDID